MDADRPHIDEMDAFEPTHSPSLNDDGEPIDMQTDYTEEQSAIGRLASMTLIAAVTANGQSPSFIYTLY